ncbi:MAG: nucleoside recognition domain-containing protein [Lachnospiraceae bacterium]
MLNYIWSFMILVGIIYGSISGNIANVSNGILNSAKDAVTLCITMLGVMALWTGIMKIAEESGMVKDISRKLIPVITKLFPGVPKDHKAFEYIALNIIANILGLGWAATPAGLKAMEELQRINIGQCKKDYGKDWEAHSFVASDAMCTFLVINISSLQLIPVNIIAYRSQYGSVNPSVIVAPVIAATFISTFAGVLYCLWKIRGKRRGRRV